jgi:hypothetical protein
MGRCIVKLGSKYVEWSSVSDAPVTYGMTLEELKDHVRFRYGQEGVDELPERLARVEEYGTSSFPPDKVEDLVLFNRAGHQGSCLTLKELVDWAEGK